MKILITGSTGFVGRYLVRQLAKHKNVELVLPVRNPKKAQRLFEDLPNVRIETIKGDISLSVLIEKPDIVINLIGIIRENHETGDTFEKVHYLYTKLLVDAAKKVKVKKFLQMSALGADIDAKSRYLKSKAAAENYLKASGLPYHIFRPSIILGKGQRLYEDMKKIAKMMPILVAPKGKVQPVHILDVVESFEKCVFCKEKNEIYELCSPKVVSYKELFEFVLNCIGIKRKIIELDRKWLFLASVLGSVFTFMMITYDQWLILEKDNVCSGKFKGVKELLGTVRDPFKGTC